MKRILGLTLLAGLAQPALAQTDPSSSVLSITTGVDYSSGSYGAADDTDIVVIPVSARFKTGDWRLTATLPYLQIDGASSVVGGGGGPIIIDPNAPRSKRDGLGDLSLGASFTAIKEETAGFSLDLSASVKLPTASEEDGLGTGETDYAIGADFSKSFGNLIPFVTLGYRVPGDPDGINLESSVSASFGTTVVLGDAVAILSYDYRQSSSSLVDDAQDLFGAFSAPWGKSMNWTLSGSAGLSDGSPDFGAGLMLTFNLG